MKRVISILTIFVLIFSMLPVTYANENLMVTRDYTTKDGQYTLQANGLASELPEDAVLEKVDNKDGAEVKSLLEKQYEGELNFSIHDLVLQQKDQVLVISNEVKKTVSVLALSYFGDPYFYQYQNGELKKLEATKSASDQPMQSFYTFDVENLTGIVTLNSQGLTEKSPVDPTVTRDYDDGLDYFYLNAVGPASELPENATIKEKSYNESNIDYEAVDRLLKNKYDGELNFTMHDVILQSGDNELTLSEKVKTTVKIDLVSSFGDPYVYQYREGKLYKLDVKKSEGAVSFRTFYSFETQGLQGLVLVDSNGITEKDTNVPYTRTYTDADDLFFAEITVPANTKLPEQGHLVVKKDTDATQATKLEQQLQKKYSGPFNYDIYDIDVLDTEGKTYILPEEATVTLTHNFAGGEPHLFSFTNGELKKLAVTKQNSKYSFTVKSLQNVVVLDTTALTVKRFSDFAEGKYSITANLYVKGENNVVLPNVTAYLTNPDLPPVSPMTHNAVMTVDEYGHITLDVPVANPIFSLQHIEDGTDIHIISQTFGLDAHATPDTFGPYKGRIQQLTLTVDNLNGEYAFTNAKQYPIILKEDTNMDIHLGVEFDGAVRLLDGDGKVFTFEDTASKTIVNVQTTNSEVLKTLEKAKLKVAEITTGTLYEKAIEQLKGRYVDVPQFKLYDLKLLNELGNEMKFTSSESLEISFAVGNNREKMDLLTFSDEKLVEQQVKIENDQLQSQALGDLGLFIVADSSSVASWLGKKIVHPTTGAILKAYSMQDKDDNLLGAFNSSTVQFMDLLINKKIDSITTASERQRIISSGTDIVNPKVHAVYDMGVIVTLLYGMVEISDNNNPIYGASWSVWNNKDKAFMNLFIPTANQNSQFYVVTDDGVKTTAEKLQSTYENGFSNISLIPRTATPDEAYSLLFGLYWNYREVEPTVKRPIKYIVEVTEQKIAKPVARAALTATDAEQAGVAESEGYTLTGHKATVAGKYTAVATLKEGYVWADGTTEPVQIAWEITKKDTAAPEAKPVTKTVTANLYVPGEKNTQLPGVNAYLTNGNNPLGEEGYAKVAPTTPMSNNAKLTTDANGKMTLVLDVLNPVFTLQNLGGSSNAKVLDMKTTSGNYGQYSSRISQVTIELFDQSGTYVFNNSVEHPTILGLDWYVPLTLSVEFDGGSSKLPSQIVDVGDIGGGSSDDDKSKEEKPKDDESKDDKSKEDDTNKDEEGKEDPAPKPDENGKGDESNDKGKENVLENGTVVKEQVNDDGQKVVTMTTANGSTTEAIVSPTGEVVATIALSKQEIDKANNVPIVLPMPEVKVSKDLETAPVIKLTSVGDDKEGVVKVTVPVTNVTPGTVIMMVNADGTTSIVTDTKYNNGNLTFDAQANVTYKVVDNSKTFKDLKQDAWFNEYVQYSVARGWMNGSDDNFRPNENLTRAQFVTILHRIHHSEEPSTTKAFKDVSANRYYAKSAAWALENGYMTGREDGTFGANQAITREQLLVVLWRAAGSPSVEKMPTNYSDFNRVSKSAQTAVAWALENNIISGTADGKLNPKGKATRAQSTKIIMNFEEGNY